MIYLLNIVPFNIKMIKSVLNDLKIYGSREIGVSPRSQFFTQLQFFSTYYACAAFDWVLLATKKKLS